MYMYAYIYINAYTYTYIYVYIKNICRYIYRERELERNRERYIYIYIILYYIISYHIISYHIILYYIERYTKTYAHVQIPACCNICRPACLHAWRDAWKDVWTGGRMEAWMDGLYSCLCREAYANENVWTDWPSVWLIPRSPNMKNISTWVCLGMEDKKDEYMEGDHLEHREFCR